MDVRASILDAALRLLAEGGEITQARVCKAAGLRQSHLTYYFPTVNDLLQAVARYSIETLAAELAPGEPAVPLPSVAEGIAKGTADKRRVRVMLALVTAADRDASLKPPMRKFLRDLRSGIAPVLQERGVDATPENLAFLHTVLVGAAILQLARDNAEARNEARAVIRKAIDCIAPEKER